MVNKRGLTSNVYYKYMAFKKVAKKVAKKVVEATKEFQQRGFTKPAGFKRGDKS